MLAHVLLRLGRIWGDDELERLGVSVLRLVAPMLDRAPGAFGWALCALDLWLAPPREIAIVGPVDSPVARAALAPFAPTDGRRGRARRRRAAARGEGTGRRQAGGLRLRAVRLSGAHHRAVSRVTRRSTTLQAMTTIEQTGAEEVAWDLSDLYASRRRPAHRERLRRGRGRRSRVPRSHLRQGRDPHRGRARRRDHRVRAHRGGGDARPLLRAHELFHQHGRPRPGRPRREARREGCRPRDPAALLRARVGGDRGRHGRDAARGFGAGPLASLALRAARLPSLPADRAGGEDPHREGRQRRLGVVAAVRGGARRHPRRPRRPRARRARDRDGQALLVRSRRAPGSGRGGHGRPAADDPDPHLDLQLDPRRQVDRRPAARLPDLDHVAEPRQRDVRRRRAGADRRDHLALRRAAALLPPEGEAPRPRPALALRPVRPGRRRRLEDVVERGAAHRRRRVLQLLDRGRQRRRAVLRRRLDRCPGAARQAPRRLLRDERPRRPSRTCS